MQSLSAEKILALWETGRLQHALDRALTILAAATPGASRAALADLPIGERDARLLELRAVVFGARAEGFAECPNCTERVEFPLDTRALEGRGPSRPSDVRPCYETETNGATIRFRLPTSRDLAEVVTAPDSSEALRRLAARCLLWPNDSDARGPQQPNLDLDGPFPDARSFGALRQPQDDKARELSDEVIAALSRAILEADPQAEIILRLTCPACGHEWDLLFDIAEFFWREISAQAQRLLREIDTLARAYGWTEREILTLPAQRRQTYLEMLAA